MPLQKIKNAKTTARTTIKLVGLLALALVAMLVPAPSGALAAPIFGVTVEHQADPISETPGIVTRTDQIFQYKIAFSNTGTSGFNVGDIVSCTEPTFSGEPAKPFAYRWTRNGVDIPGATSKEYTLAAGDAGKPVQCVVSATNLTGTSQSSSERIVVQPEPTVAPPTPPGVFVGPSETPSAGGTLTCKAGSWGTTSPPTSYAFKLYRNGSVIRTSVASPATSAAFTLTAEDVATPAGFQCSVVASNEGGSVFKGLSTARNTSPNAPSPVMPNASNRPTVTPPSTTVKVTLPPGVSPQSSLGTVFTCLGWICTIATMECTRTSAPATGAEAFPPLTVRLRLFGNVAPDELTASATISGGGAPSPVTGQETFTLAPHAEFGIRNFFAKSLDQLGNPNTQAGGHPFSGVTSNSFYNYVGYAPKLIPVEDPKTISVELPPGFLGNPLGLPKCPTDLVGTGNCPPEAQVGTVRLAVIGAGPVTTGVFNVQPSYGHPAEFAFVGGALGEVHLFPSVRSDSDYGITMTSPDSTQAQLLFVDFKFWGTPADPIHNSERCLPGGTVCNTGATSSSPLKALLTNPTNCNPGPQTTTFRADSWQHPGKYASLSYDAPPTTGCQALNDNWSNGVDKPSISFQPDNHKAATPVGFDVNIHVPQEGLADPNRLATPNLYGSTVTLPEGVAISPAAAHGLEACSEAQMGLTSESPVHFNLDSPNCPDSSKVGTMEVQTPVLADPLVGSIFLAAQDENPFHSRFGLYLTIDDKAQGLMLKLAGKVVADPVTGQLQATFTENPQLPFTDLRLHFFDGSRSALVSPDTCGTYTTNAALTPWSAVDPANPTAAETAYTANSFAVTEGPGGGACANSKAERPFSPSLDAGTLSTKAGADTPFVLNLTRPDGQQEMSSLEVSVPKGLTASLRGVPYCSEAQIAQAKANDSGAAEKGNPSCPSAAKIGTVTVGAGSGSEPLYVGGNAYLAGPYKGAPLSMAIVTPAVAGPFDLGTVVVRAGLYLDPVSAQITVKSDPIPQILDGVPLQVRSISVKVDRDGFTRNPTNCSKSSVGATLGGGGKTAALANPFQVGGCGELAFSPKLALNLKGGTHRNDHPALTATLTQAAGQANIGAVSVALPHSEFLDQAHIRTVCTRVQFAAKACPAGSIYGSAEAISPLLDAPLSGPVYLRSSDNKLPDLVVALRGPDAQPIEINLAGRIDSVNGGIRNSFELVPDAAVSQFTLKMKGGKKGLLVNSRDICKRTERATVRMIGQNGKRADQFPKLSNGCKKAKPNKKRSAKR